MKDHNKVKLLLLLLLAMPLSSFPQSGQQPYLIVLGVTQDGGYPHIGCDKSCCAGAWANDSLSRMVVSLALADPLSRKWWLMEATPDITRQLPLFSMLTKGEFDFLPSGIFLTHAHIGHYTGLMYLGKEALNTQNVPVYTLPRMNEFLKDNGPWSQLANIQNINLIPITVNEKISLNENVSVEAFTVPHRDEYSETAGFRIMAGEKKYLFIPDIDKWSKFEKNIVQEVKEADAAFLDATFYSADELPGRSMSTVPHPLVTETMDLFNSESTAIRSKIYFIHFNHTNPLLWNEAEKNRVRSLGFEIAEQGMKF
jgi:pyrroloquinoline quinone biosynthesis protein B